MDKFMVNQNQVTMSSLEIAKLTGKRHDHVLVDIKNILEELKIHSPEFSGQYKDSTGRTLPCFNLPKRETLILISGYSAAIRARIIDRLDELEQKQVVSEPVQISKAQELIGLHTSLRDDMVKMGVQVGIATSKMYDSITKQTGIDLSDYAKALPAANEVVATLNATALGKIVGLSARSVNATLADMGLQTKAGDSWALTPAGLEYADQIPYTRNGHSGYQIMWKENSKDLFVKKLGRKHKSA